MIKNNKRAAEQEKSTDEPIKKKIAKFDQKSNDKSKFNKGPKPFGNKKFGGKPGATNGNYTKGKFQGKPTQNKFNKFANKKEDGKATSDGGSEPEKTDWAKFKKEKKDLKNKRKQTRDTYEISKEAKQIYEKLNCKRTEKKAELVEQLYKLFSVGDTLKKVVMAHDTARVIQCMLKHSSPALRDQLSEKLMPLVVDMCVSKYSHHCVVRMMDYGSAKVKSQLVDSLMGNVVRLASHSISSKILDQVYLTLADAKQKSYMRQEFYGDLYKKSKDNNVKTLADTYKETTNMKASILGACKSNLERVANKQLLDSSVVHAVLLEYINELDDEKMEEAIGTYASMVPLMLTTKEGCEAAIICFYKATPKNRRAIIKAIKEHLIKICTHEHGHVFILAVLNALDDTKATKKAIYDTIHPELHTLMGNLYGRRVVQWLVSPADTNCWHPAFIAKIEQGLAYGKKDKELRRKEILEQIEDPIASAIAEKPEVWLADSHVGLTTVDVLKNLSNATFVKAARPLTSIIVQPNWQVNVVEDSKDKNVKKAPQDIEKIIAEATKQKKKKQQELKKKQKKEEQDEENEGEAEDDEETAADETKKGEQVEVKTVAGIEDAGFHIVLKKIIKHDKERLTKNEDSPTFGALLVEQLSDETLQHWLTMNRACFVLLNIVEQNNDATLEAMKSLIAPHKALLKKQKFKGAELLQKKLSL